MHFKSEQEQIIGWLAFKAVFNEGSELIDLKQITELPKASLLKKLKLLQKQGVIKQEKTGNWKINLDKLPQAVIKKFTQMQRSIIFDKNAHLVQEKLIKSTLDSIAKIIGIEAIAVCNSFSLKTTTTTSDIDLLIVCRESTFFLTRLLVTCYLHLKGIRLHGNKTCNRFCLSFWLTDKNLNLTQCLRGKDAYFYYWFRTLNWFVLPANSKMWQKNLVRKNKSWLKKFNLSYQKSRFPKLGIKITSVNRPKHENNFFVQKLNRFLGNWQLKRAQKKLAKMGSRPGVIIKSDILKFHTNDHRPEINKAYWYLLRQIKHYFPQT